MKPRTLNFGLSLTPCSQCEENKISRDVELYIWAVHFAMYGGKCHHKGDPKARCGKECHYKVNCFKCYMDLVDRTLEKTDG